jgi:hypothetical protein
LQQGGSALSQKKTLNRTKRNVADLNHQAIVHLVVHGLGSSSFLSPFSGFQTLRLHSVVLHRRQTVSSLEKAKNRPESRKFLNRRRIEWRANFDADHETTANSKTFCTDQPISQFFNDDHSFESGPMAAGASVLLINSRPDIEILLNLNIPRRDSPFAFPVLKCWAGMS